MIATLSKGTKQMIAVVCVGMILLFLIFVAIKRDLQQDHLHNVYVGCQNSNLVVRWELPLINNAEAVSVCIEGDGYSKEILLPPHKREFVFEDGNHGKRYSVTVTELYRDGSMGTPVTKETLCFDESQLPDLPIIRIDTTNNIEPTSDTLDAPEGLSGKTIINNDPVDGVMNYSINQSCTITSRIQIRLRGNTSSACFEKKAYSITLDNPVDMLQRGGECTNKEWFLLNTGTSMNEYIGEYLAERCGRNWIAHMTYVNVVINGDWKGLYCLAEAYNCPQFRDLVSDDGFLLENDAYWWKPNTIFFKVDQIRVTGITVKHPSIKDLNDPRLDELADFMQAVADGIGELDEDYLSFIDTESFISWIIVKDLMNVVDLTGSNYIFYIDRFDHDNYSNNIITMGPVWDLSSGMLYESDSWEFPSQHIAFLYSSLFQMNGFRSEYKTKWEAVSDGLSDDFRNEMEEFYSNYGQAIQESRMLDSERWNTDVCDLRDEIDYDEALISSQVSFIDSMIVEW